MNRVFSLLFSLVLFGTCLSTFAQDTTKHTVKKPQGIVVPSEYHPVTRPGFKHLGKNYKNYKRDSTLKAQSTTAIHPDTAKTPVKLPPAQPAYVDNTILGQYNALNKNLGGYERGIVGAFYRNLMDTLNTARKALKDSSAKLAEQTKAMAGLQAGTAAKEQSLAESISKVNQMSFIGIPVAKTTFQYIMWGLVVVLAGAAITIYSLSGATRKEAAYRTQLYEELEEEYKAYKVKASDKEKKLARELQTERNKLDDLLGNK
ncbi:hypothetical protein BEL04_17385 [Mucilaginibacter sp. PPCGB 2223]|uniref:DUF4199 domain-containing protein n=1 Tax=Mucilaginibacter sp. PPCGB 2223 TaxID=1886027 RepID=UPI000826782F|nr:DUF4199 domain-containing protein [Mucilaginibacter sp. PPCGB 2223]OCX51785.1 hypothetical protein BEL04_17385 [Mucilaginibacter sp. PPCGB 2223]